MSIRRHLRDVVRMMTTMAIIVGNSCSKAPSPAEIAQRTAREEARQAMVGIRISSLNTIEAREYLDVEISKVTPEGIRVIHSEGVALVPFEVLPEKWSQQAMFDPDEARAFRASKQTHLKERKQQIAALKNQSELKELSLPKDEQALHHQIETEMKLSSTQEDKIQALVVEAGALTKNSARWKSKWKRIRALESQRRRHQERVRAAKELLHEKERARRKRDSLLDSL